MRKIGIMGGTFDPCHNGHINLAKDALKQAKLDKVILMPTKVQPFKIDKKTALAKHRINMLSIAAKDIDDILISAWEVNQKDISYTYKMLNSMKNILGEDTKIYFILGIDSFLSIDTWKNSDELLRSNSFIVGKRPGYKEEELNIKIDFLSNTYNSEIIKIDNTKIHISSSEIREKIKNNENDNKYIKKEVMDYINENGLYI